MIGTATGASHQVSQTLPRRQPFNKRLMVVPVEISLCQRALERHWRIGEAGPSLQ